MMCVRAHVFRCAWLHGHHYRIHKDGRKTRTKQLLVQRLPFAAAVHFLKRKEEEEEVRSDTCPQKLF